MRKRINSFKLLTLLTVAAVLFAALFCALPLGVSADLTAPALDQASPAAYNGASTAGTYGGVNANELWYYGADFINLPALKTEVSDWTLNSDVSGDPIVVAVIDTGLSKNHSLFDDVLMTGTDGRLLCYNSYYGSQKSATEAQLTDITDNDRLSHGTAVAGIIAMLIKELGLEQFIKIMPIKASYKDGNNETFGTETIAEGIEWAAENGASVINMSLSSTDNSGTSETWAKNRGMLDAVASATETAVLVAAAGNDYKSTETRKFYPASYPEVVSVMAYGDDGTKLNSSNYGEYDIIAPGEDIYTAKSDGWQRISGTSMSSAFVSMCAALMSLKYRSELKAGEISADKVPAPSSIASSMGTKGNKTVQFEEYTFRALDVAGLLAISTEEIGSVYLNPKGLSVKDADGLVLERQLNNVAERYYEQRLDKAQTLELIAEFTPGGTDPDRLNDIKWFKLYEVKEKYTASDGQILEREVTVEEPLGQGARIRFTPGGGEYTIEARYKTEEYDFAAEVQFAVEYLPFVGGEVRVTLADQADRSVGEATGFFVGYTRETYSLALTGMKYVDPSKEIIWYVNGAEAGKGRVFDFRPTKMGDYSISASYDGIKVAFEHELKIQVKSAAERPADLATAIIVPLILCSALATVAVIVSRNKKRAADKS